MATAQPKTSLQNLFGSFAQPSEAEPRLTGKMFVTDYRAWDRVLSELIGRPAAEPQSVSTSTLPTTQAQTPHSGRGHQAPAIR